MTGALVRPRVGAHAVVCCVHNRTKREWVDVEKFKAALQEVGADLRTFVVHSCACCGNLFVSKDDTPRFCQQCEGLAVFPLGGPLPDPTGRLE